MALPTTITGPVPALTAGPPTYGGPFLSSGGNVYVVSFDGSTTGSKLRMYKATDPTSSFSEADSADAPAINDPDKWAAVQDGDVLHIAYFTLSGVSAYNRYVQFDMSTDQWGTAEVIQDTVDNGPATVDYTGGGISVRSDGSVVVLFNGDGDLVMGTDYARADYRIRSAAGSWGTITAVDGAGSVHYTAGPTVLGASDRTHFVYSGDNTTHYHRSLSSADALDTAASFDTSTAARCWTGVAFADGGNTKVRFLYRDSGGVMSVLGFVSGADPTLSVVATTISTYAPDVDSTPILMVDSQVQYCLYTPSATVSGARLLYTGTNNDTWGNEATIETFGSAAGTSVVYANLYTRGSDKMIAYWWYNTTDNAKYDEYVLTPAVPEQKFWFRTMHVPGMRYPLRGLHIGRSW